MAHNWDLYRVRTDVCLNIARIFGDMGLDRGVLDNRN